MDVSFIVPNDLPSDTTIEVTFYQDGKAVGSEVQSAPMTTA